MGIDVSERANLRAAVRSFDLTTAEFRAGSADGDAITFEGVASVVDTPYTVRDQWGEFTETIRSGAFNRTLKNAAKDVGLFVNHNTRALPLANRLPSVDSPYGRMTLAADPHLRVVATLNPLRNDVNDVRHAVNDGQARQMSIGFNVPKDARKDVWNADFTERSIHELVLHEASIVWQGASPTTTGAMRSFDEWLDELVEAEMIEADIRRAIAALELRLPTDPTPPEVVNLFADRDRADRERLERKIAARPAPLG